MAVIATVVGNVGAGTSQVRPQSHVQAVPPRDLGNPGEHASAAALALIQQTLSVLGPTGHDLDVLA